jgi:hypothetical protein
MIIGTGELLRFFFEMTSPESWLVVTSINGRFLIHSYVEEADARKAFEAARKDVNIVDLYWGENLVDTNCRPK